MVEVTLMLPSASTVECVESPSPMRAVVVLVSTPTATATPPCNAARCFVAGTSVDKPSLDLNQLAMGSMPVFLPPVLPLLRAPKMKPGADAFRSSSTSPVELWPWRASASTPPVVEGIMYAFLISTGARVSFAVTLILPVTSALPSR